MLASGRKRKWKFVRSWMIRTATYRMILSSRHSDGPLPAQSTGELNREVVIDRTEAVDDTTYLSELEGRLRESMPENLILSPTENRAADRAAMTAAFRLNLTILSLIAILVGYYLILQALDAAVVRRRAEIATLRSLGVGVAFFLNYLTEALALGLVGSMLGVGVGHILAHGAVSMLSDTVNALYFATSVEPKLTFRILPWGC